MTLVVVLGRSIVLLIISDCVAMEYPYHLYSTAIVKFGNSRLVQP